MRTQFWRTITPVEGEPIPDGAEYLRVGDPLGKWKQPVDSEFTEMYSRLEWRVPVECVPLDVAVEALLNQLDSPSTEHDMAVLSERYSHAEIVAMFRDKFTAKLREMSEEK